LTKIARYRFSLNRKGKITNDYGHNEDKIPIYERNIKPTIHILCAEENECFERDKPTLELI